jgi:hypothetical protein
MIKRAAITGHTSGLGYCFFETLKNQGYQVHGFSRSNGYDLRDYSCVTKMIEKIQDFDLFVNNAKPDYAQSQILYRLCRSWNHGTIVSIGSQAIIDHPGWTDLYLLEYLTQKVALAHAHQELSKISSCRLELIHPAHLDHGIDSYVKQILSNLEL